MPWQTKTQNEDEETFYQACAELSLSNLSISCGVVGFSKAYIHGLPMGISV